MTTAAIKVVAALLVSGMGITAGPVPNPLFHDPKPVYPDFSLTYPAPNSLFAERAGYPYRESNPYLPEPLLSDVGGALSDLYPEDDLVSPGGDLTSDRLRLTSAERSQLLGVLTDGLGPAEGDDYEPFGYGLPQPGDPDWYEMLGLVSPYDSEDADDEYDYMGEVDTWPQGNVASQMAARQDLGVNKKASFSPAAETSLKTSLKKPATTAAVAAGDDDESSSEDGTDSGESLVRQIDDLRKAARQDAAHAAASQPEQVRHTSVPVPSSTTSTTTTTTTTTAPSAALPGKDARPGSGEAPLADQLRAAAGEPPASPQTTLTDSETAYETIKRFLVMEDALKRLPKKMTKKAKRFVSDPFMQQLEDLRTVKT